MRYYEYRFTDKVYIHRSRFVKIFFECFESTIIALVSSFLILTFIVRSVSVSGTSMLDTLKDGDRLIVTNLFYTPSNGDVVVISHGQHYDKPIIKRIIATGGQTLSINFNSGDVFVDGEKIYEPYIKNITTKPGDTEIPKIIPKGYIFVMGDNRDDSHDSRYYDVGLIDEVNILGKAEFIVSPFNRIRRIY